MPMLLVPFACLCRIWILASNAVGQLRLSEARMRKQLDEALLSLDSVHIEVFFAHFCAVGLLLSISLRQ